MGDTNIDLILEEFNQDLGDQALIQDNKLSFSYENECYRVRMPNQKELSQSKELFNITKLRLQKDPNHSLQKELIKDLKEIRNIDIEELYNDLEKINQDYIQVCLNLAGKKDEQKTIIQKLITDKREIEVKRKQLLNEISDHLAPSIENQAQEVQYALLTSLCTEKYVQKEDKSDDWVRVWVDYSDYNQDRNKLTYIALGQLTKLIANI